LTYQILKDYCPPIFSNIEKINTLPIIAKPVNGHHGYGIVTLSTPSQIREFNRLHPHGYLYQKKITINHEYRFNILDGDIYQISRREKLPTLTPDGGFMFSYQSLGEDAGLSDKFYEFVNNVIHEVHNHLGDNLCHYTIDVMKGMDKKYYLTELNSACGIGDFTATKLYDLIRYKLLHGQLEKYRVV
jgi:glutathione synthase/RimK-type ligase-like ATP-grasp enzyme